MLNKTLWCFRNRLDDVGGVEKGQTMTRIFIAMKSLLDCNVPARQMTYPFLLLLLTLFVLARALKASPLSGSPVGESERPLRAESNLVLVPVMVTDRLGRVVLGLNRDNFCIYDGADQQVIRFFSSEDVPISVGIIFDTSSSMTRKVERSSEAAQKFLRGSNPNDEFFLIAFNDRPKLLVDFTNSVDEVQSALAKLTPAGNTALLDAVYLGLNKLNGAHNERKALLIISDGGDNHSRYNPREIWSMMEESESQIYAMGIFDETPRTKAERMGPDLLKSMSSVTGGLTFAIHDLRDVGDAADKLATELRNQYLIAYRPSNLLRNGKWHRISVRLTLPNQSYPLRVNSKAGYYAPAQ